MTISTRPTIAGPRIAVPIAVLALAIAVSVQLIGQLKINVGIGSLVIFPMVWGLLAGLVLSVQKIKPIPMKLQKAASALAAAAVMLLVARLAFDIGPSLPKLMHAGPALLLQEAGHMLGTIVLALPLAVLLRMGKATVGATFSIDRESAFAMVSNRFGADSDQYRGVLAMYVFGTLFGALYITLVTSIVANWKIFDPLALAMGAGVGSGSMMAASAASIVAAYPADKDAILGMAAVSNLITSLLGVYVGIYVALPLADRFYRFLTRNRSLVAVPETVLIGQTGSGTASAAALAVDDDNASFREEVAESTAHVAIPLWLSLSILAVLGLATAFVAAKGFSWEIVGGYAVMIALLFAGTALEKVTKKVSAIIWVTTIGAYISSPWSPLAEPLHRLVGSVDFLSITTIVLTLAGLSLGKDFSLLRRIGWKIIPVGLVAITASFLLSSLIAEFTLGFWK